MDEVTRPPSRNSSMSEDELIGSSVVCSLEEFNSHEVTVQQSLGEFTRPEKRCRMTSDEQDVNEDANQNTYTLVMKKRNKRFKKINYNQKTNSVTQREREIDLSSGEVCVTSTEALPKQIGMAKLLKTENIPNISQIKYKSPYKMLMKFQNRDDAMKLINNKKFMELGYRCQLTNEVSVTYGVVKYIEMEMNEEELMKAFTSDAEITSVKRLKRMNETGGWTDSETVRFCFKSNTLPKYVYGYECRFQVEPYTFPVTQCSACWKYGHMVRMCPTKKIICPKCSGEHANCEVTDYRCSNCRGRHMAFYKKCPVFIKEKTIRQIMCSENCTYKMALSKYLEEKIIIGNEEHNEQHESDGSYIPTSTLVSGERNKQTRVLTSHQVSTEALIHDQADSEDAKSSEEEDQKISYSMAVQKQNKKKGNTLKKPISTAEKNKKIQSNITQKEASNPANGGKKENKLGARREKDTFNYILSTLKNILCSEGSWEDKLKLVLNFVLEEVITLFIGAISNGDIIKKLMNLYNG